MTKSGNGGGSTASAPLPIMGAGGGAAPAAPPSSVLPTIPGAANMTGPGSALGAAPPIIPPMPLGAASMAMPGVPQSLQQPNLIQPPQRSVTPPIVAAGNSPADQAMAANQKAAQDAVASRQAQGGQGPGGDAASALSGFSPEELLKLFL